MRNNNVACRCGPELPLKPSGPGSDFSAVLHVSARAFRQSTGAQRTAARWEFFIGPPVKKKIQNKSLKKIFLRTL